MRKISTNVVLSLGLLLACGDDGGTSTSSGSGTESSTGPTTGPTTTVGGPTSDTTTDVTTDTTTVSTTDSTTATGTETDTTASTTTDTADTGTAETGPIEGCGEGEMWAEPSCMKPPKKIGMVPGAGCYETCQGDPNECEMGTCQPVWVETTCPCPPWEDICCDGCGGSVITLCIP